MRWHLVYIEPGEVVLYESAACNHGRDDAYLGEAYANIFTHFKPLNFQEDYINTL